MTNQPQVPAAPTSGLSGHYWEGTKRDLLMLQRCDNCGKVRHYPQVLCPECHTMETSWIRASGRGTLHSWTIAHHAFHPAFAEATPYILLTVDLEENVRSMGVADGMDPDALTLGLPLIASFRARSDGFKDLIFRLA